MPISPVMEDAELVAFTTNLVIIKFDNNQLEIVYDPNFEPQALNTAQVSMLNTVTADEFGNIQFAPEQGGKNLFNRAALKNYFNTLNLVGVSNDV